MDADDVFEIVSNDRVKYDDAYERAHKIMISSKPAGDPLAEIPSAELSGKIGDAIREMIEQDAAVNFGPAFLAERCLTSSLIARALGSVSWNDVGLLFYQSTRERYMHQSSDSF